jgi:hypothetical protein
MIIFSISFVPNDLQATPTFLMTFPGLRVDSDPPSIQLTPFETSVETHRKPRILRIVYVFFWNLPSPKNASERYDEWILDWNDFNIRGHSSVGVT